MADGAGATQDLPVVATRLPELANRLCPKCGTPARYATPTFRGLGAEPLRDEYRTYHTSAPHVDWKCRCGNDWITYPPR